MSPSDTPCLWADRLVLTPTIVAQKCAPPAGRGSRRCDSSRSLIQQLTARATAATRGGSWQERSARPGILDHVEEVLTPGTIRSLGINGSWLGKGKPQRCVQALVGSRPAHRSDPAPPRATSTAALRTHATRRRSFGDHGLTQSHRQGQFESDDFHLLAGRRRGDRCRDRDHNGGGRSWDMRQCSTLSGPVAPCSNARCGIGRANVSPPRSGPCANSLWPRSSPKCRSRSARTTLSVARAL